VGKLTGEASRLPDGVHPVPPPSQDLVPVSLVAHIEYDLHTPDCHATKSNSVEQFRDPPPRGPKGVRSVIAGEAIYSCT